MRKLILICMFVFLCGVACNGTKTGALKAGMPGTLALSNGEVIYDLNGKWDIVTNVGSHATFTGVIDMKQEGNLFVGTLDSDNFPGLETSEKVKGKLKGNDIEEIQFNTIHGWINSTGEIAGGGKTLEIITQSASEGFDIFSTLKKR